jgi:hypothetical protein
LQNVNKDDLNYEKKTLKVSSMEDEKWKSI